METKWYHGVKWKLIERRTVTGELWLQVANGAWDTTHNGAKNAIADDLYSAMSEDERLQQGRLLAASPETATQRDELLEALKAILNAETHSLHVGYDHGGNYVYADVVRIDDEAFDKARSAISRATGASQKEEVK